MRVVKYLKILVFLLGAMFSFNTVLAEADNSRVETAANLKACLIDNEAQLAKFLDGDGSKQNLAVVKRVKSRIKFLEDEAQEFSDVDPVDISKLHNDKKRQLELLNSNRHSMSTFEFYRERSKLDHFSFCSAKEREFAVIERKFRRESAEYVTKAQEQEIMDTFVDVLMDQGVNKIQLRECAFSRATGSVPPVRGEMIELKETGVDFNPWIWTHVALSYSLKHLHQKSDGVKPLPETECNKLFYEMLEKSDKKIARIIKS